MNNQLDMSRGYAITGAIREAKAKAQGKGSYSVPLMTAVFPATIEETMQEQNSIETKLKSKASMSISEVNRLEGRLRELTRHLLSLGYKEKELQTQQLEQAEIIEALKAQGIEVTTEELAHYL